MPVSVSAARVASTLHATASPLNVPDVPRGSVPPADARGAARRSAQDSLSRRATFLFPVAGDMGGFGDVNGSGGFGTVVEAKRFRP